MSPASRFLRLCWWKNSQVLCIFVNLRRFFFQFQFFPTFSFDIQDESSELNCRKTRETFFRSALEIEFSTQSCSEKAFDGKETWLHQILKRNSRLIFIGFIVIFQFQVNVYSHEYIFTYMGRENDLIPPESTLAEWKHFPWSFLVSPSRFCFFRFSSHREFSIAASALHSGMSSSWNLNKCNFSCYIDVKWDWSRARSWELCEKGEQMRVCFYKNWFLVFGSIIWLLSRLTRF